MTNAQKGQLQVSQRIQETMPPCVVFAASILKSDPSIKSLAQGMTYWSPPQSVLQKISQKVFDPAMSPYSPDAGIPILRERLREKIVQENGLNNYDVMVTTGAQQAFINLLLAFTDKEDYIMLFKPFYFNHLMAAQMTGHYDQVVLAESTKDNYHPDFEWLQNYLDSGKPIPKMMVVVNPSNPTGASLSEQELKRLNEISVKYGIWLIVDNAYEYFTFDGRKHITLPGPNTIHVFSLSKSYGAMGWRVGYIAFPNFQKDDYVYEALVKVQDTVPVCVSQISQQFGLACLDEGPKWVYEKVDTILNNRQKLIKTLSILYDGQIDKVPNEGSIYVWAKLPEDVEDDYVFVEWLARKHKVMTIQGQDFGTPGYFRCSFANVSPENFDEANDNLKKGLQDLMQNGYKLVRKDLENIKQGQLVLA